MFRKNLTELPSLKQYELQRDVNLFRNTPNATLMENPMNSTQLNLSTTESPQAHRESSIQAVTNCSAGGCSSGTSPLPKEIAHKQESVIATRSDRKTLTNRRTHPAGPRAAVTNSSVVSDENVLGQFKESGAHSLGNKRIREAYSAVMLSRAIKSQEQFDSVMKQVESFEKNVSSAVHFRGQDDFRAGSAIKDDASLCQGLCGSHGVCRLYWDDDCFFEQID